MKLPKVRRDQIIADAKAINELIARSYPPRRRLHVKKKASRPRRLPQLPVPKDSADLCKRLACIAGFDDSPERQALIYLAIRTLQRLDRAAVETGILSVPTNEN